MYSDNEFLSFLPSNQKDLLHKSIGRTLLEVERFFQMDVLTFLKYTSFEKNEFFSHNSGCTQFYFKECINHSFGSFEEQLSIVLLPNSPSEDDITKSYMLSTITDELVSSQFKSCIGKVCQDVRIWTLQEDFESEEAKEAAVSYFFQDDLELFYCIYLHKDLDNDYLLLAPEIQGERVATCFSLLVGDYIDVSLTPEKYTESLTY
jgi:hypothetical protein